MISIISLILLSVTTLATMYLTIEKILVNKKEKQMQDEVKNTTNEELVKRIQVLEDKIERLQSTLLTFTQAQTNVMQQLSTTIENSKGNFVGQQTKGERKLSQIQNTSATKPTVPEKIETFLAKPKQSNGNLVLTIVGDEYRSQATFIIEAKGNLGQYSVNAEAQKRLLNYLDTTILPYADCELKTSAAPTKIVTEKKGKTMLKDGVWVIETKAVVKIY